MILRIHATNHRILIKKMDHKNFYYQFLQNADLK